MNRCSGMDSQCDVQRRSQCTVSQSPDDLNPSSDDHYLYTYERIIVTFIQLKNYLGSYWLPFWFFVFVYPSILVYESHGFAGSFIYCNIVELLFFIVFEFWDESFIWTPLHDSVRTYSSQILGRQHITKSVDELILFCIWVLSWAAVPTLCFINGRIFELPSDCLERLTSYVSIMTVTFVMAYIFILLWIDMNLLEVKSSTYIHSKNGSLSKSELIDSIEPGDIPDLETVYEDISITSQFTIDDTLLEFSEAVNENIVDVEESCYFMNVEQGEEAKDPEIDVISLSSSTLSDFDVITEEEISLLK